MHSDEYQADVFNFEWLTSLKQEWKLLIYRLLIQSYLFLFVYLNLVEVVKDLTNVTHSPIHVKIQNGVT
jgi:hypothetical protein